MPLPFAMWRILGAAAEWLPSPPLTKNQIELMEIDNVASPTRPGFSILGVKASRPEDVVNIIAHRSRG
jgi:NADH dehydrogenase